MRNAKSVLGGPVTCTWDPPITSLGRLSAKAVLKLEFVYGVLRNLMILVSCKM